MLELCTGIHVTKKRIYCLWSLSAYLSILTGLFGLNCLVWQATVIKLTKWFPVSTKHTYKFQWLTNFLKIYLFFAALGLHCCTKAFSSCSQRGYSWVLVASLVAKQTPGAQASVIAARGPSSSEAYGICPDQGSTLSPLHWQADTPPLDHQASPNGLFSCS